MTKSPYSISELVSAHAGKHPDTPAVGTDAGVLTYGELEQRADHLAKHLLELGLRRENTVAICLDRSFESIIGSLAVLKAGGAYLPVDPKLPIERFNLMMNDARPQVLISKSQVPGEFGSCSVKMLDLARGERSADSSDLSSAAPTKDQLAYVIYTSGSTGKPKGVEITIGNLHNLISWHQTEFKNSAPDAASNLASVAFDAAVCEVSPYLTAGASLYLPDEATRLSPEALRDWLVKNQITIRFLPTALAERVLELDWPRDAA